MGTYGTFNENVIAEWLVEDNSRDRKMKLVRDFTYTDPDGKVWLAAKGRTIDGASIPDFLWGKIMGSPFTGDYRFASVVHDIACQDKPGTSDQTHKMFYYAMLCGGTADWLAKTMYEAVKLFGPQWSNGRKSLPQTSENIQGFYSLVDRTSVQVHTNNKMVAEHSLEYIDKGILEFYNKHVNLPG